MLCWSHVARIWLPAWLDDREQVLDDFEVVLRQALDAPSVPTAADVPSVEITPGAGAGGRHRTRGSRRRAFGAPYQG